MGLLGDIANSLLGSVTGNNRYADEVMNAYLVNDKDFIRFIDRVYNEQLEGDANYFTKATGYARGFYNYTVKHLEKIEKIPGAESEFRLQVKKTITYCKDNSYKSKIFDYFRNALERALNGQQYV